MTVKERFRKKHPPLAKLELKIYMAILIFFKLIHDSRTTGKFPLFNDEEKCIMFVGK